MEISLAREALSFAERVHNETRRTEETAEVIVPDALPDILRIFGADAEVTVRSKDLVNGRAAVSGNALVTVIYAPDGEVGMRRVIVDLPFTVAVDNAEITAASRILTRIRVDSIGADALNPRKIGVRAALVAELSVYNTATVELPVSISDEGDAEIELRTDSAELSLDTEVREKTFTVTDEYQINAANPPVGELLHTSVALTADDTKVVGTKLIFKGTANVNLLYAAVSGELAAGAFTTEFSQILELDNASADSEFELVPLLTASNIVADNRDGSDGRRVNVELQIVAQAVAHSRVRVAYIGDAYGSRHALTAEHTQLQLTNRLGVRSANSILRGTLTATEIARIISISARIGTAAHTFADGSLAVRTPVHVDALYVAADGSVRIAADDFTLDATLADADAGSDFLIRAEVTRDVYGVAADGGIELRIPVEITAEETRTDAFAPISAITIDEESPLDLSALPSLVIVRGQASLWDLAKRHHSTRELILQANSLDDEDAALRVGTLIVPKKR